MTEEQLRDYIDSYIRQNGRNSITGDQMNIVLNALIGFILDEVSGAPSSNLSNSNLTLDQNRSFDFDSFTHDFGNVKSLKIKSEGTLPAIGEATFESWGSGTGLNRNFALRDFNGNILQEQLDNGDWNYYTPAGDKYFNADASEKKVDINGSLYVKTKDQIPTNYSLFIETNVGVDIIKVLNNGKIGIGKDPTAVLDVRTAASGETFMAENLNNAFDSTIRLKHGQINRASVISLESSAGTLMQLSSSGSTFPVIPSRPRINYMADLAFSFGNSEKITMTTAGDVKTLDNTKGFVVKDRTNGNDYRIYSDGGVLSIEIV